MKGRMEGIQAADGVLRLSKGMNRGVYYSPVFDSGERQTVWNRLQIMGNFGIGTGAYLSVYAADERMIAAGAKQAAAQGQSAAGVGYAAARNRGAGKSERRSAAEEDGGDAGWKDVDTLLEDKSVARETLDALFGPYLQAEFAAPEDVLLHRVQGRYLWFRLEIEGRPRRRPEVRGIKIGFPKDTWLRYLPELYQEDRDSASFLERYLGIFQSLYEDLSDRIGDVPLHLNPRTAELNYLEWMSEWLAIENRGLWNEEQLRYLAANAASLYRVRGTVRYLKELFRLYTGREPYIEEQPLDGGPVGVTVLLDMTELEDGPDNTHSAALQRIAEMAVPAGVTCRIVVLKPGILLGQHSYLGINSVLEGRQTAQMDGAGRIPFVIGP